MNLKQLRLAPTRRLWASGSLGESPRRRAGMPVWGHALSRRHFLRSAAGAAGLVLGANLLSARAASDCPDPSPIPGGIDFLGNGAVFHVQAPGYPDSGFSPATNDAAVIKDFNGAIGLAYVRGAGTHTDKTTGVQSYLPFEVDLRFMKGEYVGVDGKRHHGAFALV
jgi:hypothetical protein